MDTMEQHAQGGRDYDGKCFICHSQCPEDARLVMDAVEERFLKLKERYACATSAPSSAAMPDRAPWRCSSWATNGPIWSEKQNGKRHP